VHTSGGTRLHRHSNPFTRAWPQGSLSGINLDGLDGLGELGGLDARAPGGSAWSIVLAGGDGTRLADYVRQRFGRALPKQYCTFTGTRSMLEHTVDRARRIAPPSRIVTVVGACHRAIALPQLEGRSDHVLWQPANRDTGPGLFFPLSYIYRWDPAAVVAIFPADHYIAPEPRFTDVVERALGLARRWPDRVITLGVRPDGADADYGYITLGAGVEGEPGLRSVVGFVEKPEPALARRLYGDGALWSTMITCATAAALWELGRATQPAMMERLDDFVPLIDEPEESEAVPAMFDRLPSVNLSRDMLERAPERLLALPLDGVTWSDWGRPERIEAVLAAGALAARSVPPPAAIQPVS
jgi:mannose-1-phosphate guanylyltransferase